MKFDANFASPSVTETDELATAAEEVGFDGAWVTETTHSPFTLTTQLANGSDRMDLGTAITVAFPRSPMVTAYTAWDLQSLSDGRFLLGLGTQVKGHIERRFSVEWDSPGPRLREYVEVLREIWASWEADRHPQYDGDFYSISLCPADWRPEPIQQPRVPVYIAGVNSYNVRLAGELCDGLHVHPLNSPAYIEQEVVPDIEAGAARGDRDPDDVTLVTNVFAITGETDAEREEAREEIRRQIAFYGSTRTYKRIFAVHGWGDVCDDLHELSVEDRWNEMPDLVTDEMVAAFSVEGAYDELRGKIEERYTHIDRISLYAPYRGEDHWHRILSQ
ncbi:TIGR03617 family F420-dependent LLM class oxidoreductase [Natrinema gelatinilyticum]|uniref:TIGR03617 family F420-dependent LLM class oxidoreductase n=1 Tax=Natrinema gelatinilyticum TaxID=2961571 RepID=UPI0020C25599|nr:TIGR03617 family F420-dependent LLM class oxidoreductase [Natrinema gelatinilyticum]